METILNDAELGQEIVQLLYRRLQREREQLRELHGAGASTSETVLVDSTAIQVENEKLRTELSALELHLSAALDSQDSKVTSQRSTEKRRVIDDAQRDLKRREATQTETIRDIEMKLDEYNLKYTAIKDDNRVLIETLAPLVAQRKAKATEMENDQERMWLMQSELEMEIESTTARLSPSFDVVAFQQGYQNHSKHPKMSDIKSFLISQPFSGLPADMRKKFGSLKILALTSNDIRWCQNDIEHGVYLVPSCSYDVDASGGKGQWIQNSLISESQNGVLRSWEVVYQSRNTWYYYGTYQYVGSSAAAPNELEARGFNAQMVRKAMKSTLLQKDQLVAPLIANFIAELATTGLLSLCFIGLKRTGFNSAFYNELLSHKKAFQQSASAPPTTKGKQKRPSRSSNSNTRGPGPNRAKKQKRS